MNFKFNRLLLIGNYSADGQKSMNAYVETLHRGLKDARENVVLLRPKSILLRDYISNIHARKWVAYIDKYVIFSIYLFFISFKYSSVCICDHSNSIYSFFIKRGKAVVVCHDVIAIQAALGMIDGWRVGWSGRVFQSLILAGLRRADKVICVSNLTEKDLLQLAPDIASKVLVISNPLNYTYAPTPRWREILTQTHLLTSIPESYIIHVGSDLPRKNRIFVLQTLIELNRLSLSFSPKVIFVGPLPNGEMANFIKLNKIERDIIFVSNINSDQLQALYSGASFMLFPSLNEGFGWPVIEAQACGCPVFASKIPPMPEVGGHAAEYFNAKDPRGAAKLIQSADLENMRLLGVENAKRFELKEMIQKFVKFVAN